MIEPVGLAAKPPRAQRIKLLLILLTPLLVLGVAAAVFFTGIGLPTSTQNKGVLIQPPRQIDSIALRDASGTPWRYSESKPDWAMLAVGPGACAGECRARVHLGRQVRIALGRDARRVRRYYLCIDGAIEPDFAKYLATEHEDLRVLHAHAEDWKALVGPLDVSGPQWQGTLHLVDPRGFVMMYYQPRQRGTDTIRDLEFLLRYSH